MKKCSAKKKNGIKRIFNKLGMTYIELICALALLSLIVVMFTPMLLSSYETLYKAGERVEGVYDSREEMEQGLARRDSIIPTKMTISLTDNALAIFDALNVSGRKVVSSMQEGFETIFGQVRAKVEIVSPNIVNDDATNHTIILQTSGIEFSRVTYGQMNSGVKEDAPDSHLAQDQIHIEAIIPDKTINVSGELDTTTVESVYGQSKKFAQVKYVDSTGKVTDFSQSVEGSALNGGRLRVNVSAPAGIDPLDFTQSPIQINVYYRNTRGKLRTVCDYLYIDPPSLIMAGEASSSADYYTSAGVEDNTALTRTGTRTLTVEGRKMRISNSPYAKTYFGTPSAKGVEIRSIRWIDNDETSGLKPYYIMTGTNGAIYRMYNYASNSSEIYKNSVYKVIRNLPNAFYNGVSGSNYNSAIVASTKSAVDGTFTTTDGSRVFPSLWSGDFSHAFDYSTAIKKINYAKDEDGKEDGCWISSDRSNFWKGAEKFNVFGMQAQMSYYYNGDACDFNFNFQNQRTISYILTETGYSLRMFGLMADHDDYNAFNSIWSSYYSKKGQDYSALIWKDMDDYNHTSASDIYVFEYGGTTTTGTLNDKAQDYEFSSIAIKFLASYNLADLDIVDSNNNYFLTSDQYEDMSDMARLPVVRIDAKNTGTGTADRTCGEAVKVNVTDSIYIPSANGVAGTTFYVGNTSGYANVVQKDNYSTSSQHAKAYRNAKRLTSNFMMFPGGAVTDYLILSNDDGTGTYITAYNDNDRSRDGKDVRKARFLNASNEVDAATTSSTDAQVQAFFYPTNYNSWKSIYLDDVHFTFGYSSNRERVYKNITYDGVSEKYRSFENFYFLSHYGTALTDTHTLNRDVCNSSGTASNGTYSNTYNNDFYNVWFPGEMYNLTKIASKDGVTVAVGYAVSGSTYQFINPSQTTNTSTALGGIYNDGVLAAMIEGKDSAFNNILYFKDNATMDTTSLSGKPGYDVFKKNNTVAYGMHTRQSVQFTAVDLVVENIRGEDNQGQMTSDAKLNYYAFYGDNRGRVFKSLVATAKGNIDTEADLNAASAGAELVPFITDNTFAGTANGTYTVGGQNLQYSTMEEIKINYGGKDVKISDKLSSIQTITASDDMVIITGVPKPGKPEGFVVGQLKDKDTWEWKWVVNGSFTTGTIEAATIVNGYFYFVGYDSSIKSSYLSAVSLETLKNVSGVDNGSSNVLTSAENTTSDPNKVLWTRTNSTAKLYAIAGRATN